MLDRKALQALGCWTGYRLERVEWPEGGGRTLSLDLKPGSVMFESNTRSDVASEYRGTFDD
ncbi:hypothetical protein [Burkholderia stagnalis]